MKFAELLQKEHVLVHSPESDKPGAIRALVELLAGSGAISDANQAFSLVMEREDEYPTGIGEAVAIPHTNCLQISKPLVAVGTFPSGIDFAAADGLKANLLVLLLSPQGNSGGHLKMLARISRLARRGLAQELVACSDSHALIEKVELAEEDLLDM